MSRVTITTGSRLHFGPLASGGWFGGLGLMINAPVCRVSAIRAARDEIVAPPETADRVRRILDRFREAGASVCLPGCRVVVESEIPAHRGLGSGTQLGMAVAKSLALLSGAPELELDELARLAGRGLRSAIGIHGFAQGGLLLDGGKSTGGEIGELIARADFPEAWRILLVTPPHASGLAGPAEVDAFAMLPPMSESLTAELMRLASDEILPAARDARFDGFSESVSVFGRLVGDYFSPVQGGRYADARMAGLVDWFHARGITGAGQTSWGPTLFVCFPDERAAMSLRAELATGTKWSDCALEIVRGGNCGASIEQL